MRIPKYWAHGRQVVEDGQGRSATFSCWFWSDTSVSDARQKAQARATKLAWKLLNNEKLGRYGYGERPLREEIHESIKHQRRDLAIVSRNAYGALILNAEKTMFIDIDFAPQPHAGGLGAIFRRLMGKVPETPETAHLQAIEQWVERHPGAGVRVYRTYAGLRCLMTHALFDPTQANSLDIMRDLDCDPLYVTLCKSQASFRARLTPKPWRCGSSQPPSRYPWDDQAAELHYREWQSQYTLAASKFTTCRLLQHFGSKMIHPDVAPVMTFHDRLACTGDDLSLA